MALTVDLQSHGGQLKPAQEWSIRRELARLEHVPASILVARLSEFNTEGQFDAVPRLVLGARMGDLIAEKAAGRGRYVLAEPGSVADRSILSARPPISQRSPAPLPNAVPGHSLRIAQHPWSKAGLGTLLHI